MSRRLPSLHALRAFEAAARHLSFTRAAEELGVTQGAVSRQIKALETYLGVLLFRRLTRALELTEAGREYLNGARDAFDRLERATQQLTSRRDGGILTVSVLPTLAMRWLIPRLATFTEDNPQIEVRMVTSIRAVDFSREDIDVAIRVGNPDPSGAPAAGPRIALTMTEDWSGVRADLLAPDILVAVCSPALTGGGQSLRTVDDLRHHTLLHTTTRPHAWSDWLRAAGSPDLSRQGEPSFGHFFMTIQAALQGRGVAVVPEMLVEMDLATKSLVKPFESSAISTGAYYLLCREHQWDVPKVRAFREWILDEVSGSETADPRAVEDGARLAGA